MTLNDIGGALARLMGTSEQEFMDSLKNPDNPEDFRSKEEIEQILNEGFSAKFQDVIKQQQGRAKRETMTDFEKQLKEMYGGDVKGMGVELVKNIVDAKVSEAAKLASEKEISEAEVKGHPVFQSAIEQLKKQAEEVTNEFTQFKQSLEVKERTNKVYSTLKNELMKLNPILPDGKEEVAMEAWLKMFDVNQFKIDDKGIVPIDQDGNPLMDEKFNPIKLPDLVAQKNIFAIHKKDPAKSSPSPNKTENGAVVVDNVTVSTLSEFAQIMADQTGKYSREFKTKLKENFINKDKPN